MYPRLGTYHSYTQNSLTYGNTNGFNYGVTQPSSPVLGGNTLTYGENLNPNRLSYGVTPPTSPKIGNAQVLFSEGSNAFRQSYGIVPPPAPNVGGQQIVFGETPNTNRPNFGISAPVLPAPRPQVNVAPKVPDIPVPQYNVPDRPIYYPPPTTYNAGDLPLPPVNNNPITYAPNTYPQPMNTGILQPFPSGGEGQFNPYANMTMMPNQGIPSNAPRSVSPRSEAEALLSDTSVLIGQGNQVAASTQQYALQEAQIRQQQQYQQQVAAAFQQAQQAQQAPPTNTPNVTGSAIIKAGQRSLEAGLQAGLTNYGDIIKREANKNGVPPSLLAGLIQQESNFDPNAGSGAGAQGLAQLMPGTAAELGVTDTSNPEQNIAGGAKYLGQMLKKYGDTTLALAAYNAGPGAVDNAGRQVPPFAETQHYVKVVQENAEKIRNAGFA